MTAPRPKVLVKGSFGDEIRYDTRLNLNELTPSVDGARVLEFLVQKPSGVVDSWAATQIGDVSEHHGVIRYFTTSTSLNEAGLYIIRPRVKDNGAVNPALFSLYLDSFPLIVEEAADLST